MFMRKNSFVVPAFAAANGQGQLTRQQRRNFFLSGLTLGFGVLLLTGGALAAFSTGKGNLIGCVLLGAAALVGLATQEPWQIYWNPKPKIVSYSGELRQIPNTSVRKGGFVTVGERRVYLSRLQVREVQFGRPYEVFLIVPHNTAVSARVMEV